MQGNIRGFYKNSLDGKSFFWMILLVAVSIFFYLFSQICFSFGAGFVLAYLCVPIVNKVSNRINRSLVSATFAIGSLLLFVMLFSYVFPPMKAYASLLAANLPLYYKKLMVFLQELFSNNSIIPFQEGINSIDVELQRYMGQKIDIFASIIEGIISQRATITQFFSFFIIMPLSFFYFLRDWARLKAYCYTCIPLRQRPFFRELFTIIRRTLVYFLHGQFHVVIILTAYYSALLYLLDMPDALLLATMSGLFSFIPFIGALFSLFIVLLVNVPHLNLMNFTLITAGYVVGQLLEGYVLSPKFITAKTGLHPLWILFSFFAGYQLEGVIGVLIAVPIAAIIKNIARFFMGSFKASQSYKQ